MKRFAIYVLLITVNPSNLEPTYNLSIVLVSLDNLLNLAVTLPHCVSWKSNSKLASSQLAAASKGLVTHKANLMPYATNCGGLKSAFPGSSL